MSATGQRQRDEHDLYSAFWLLRSRARICERDLATESDEQDRERGFVNDVVHDHVQARGPGTSIEGGSDKTHTQTGRDA